VKKPTNRPRVEEMESRLVPSGAPLTHPDLGAGLVAHAAARPALAGTLTGTYTATHVNPDTGTRYDLSGSGTLAGVGPVTAAGALRSLGFVASGHAGGPVALTNAQGTVTLQLSGPKQKGFAPLPKHFRYSVTDATGAYVHLQGRHGTADLTLGAASGTSPGPFRLALHPKAA
jgi:hypothetical protein